MADVDVAVDPLLPPQEQDTTTRTSTSGGRVMSKDAAQAIKDEYAANKAAASAQEKAGEAQALQQTAKADQEAIAADQVHAQAADLAAQQQEQADRIQAARDASAVAEEAFANHKFEDYWSKQGVGKRIAAAFPLFMGGVGAAYLGQANPAAEALNRKIDQDFALQKADLDQKREVARMKGADVNDLFVQAGHENAALAIKHAKASEATAASMVQAMTEAGIPLEQAQNNVAVKKLMGTAEEKRREALQHYDRTFQGSTTKKEVTGAAGAGSIAQQRLELQKQKLTLRDPETGEEMGMKPTADAVEKAGNDLAQIKLYRDKALALADSLEKSGHLFNPYSKEAKDRASDAADVQSIGRNLKHIQASDAGQKLEHVLIGGTGIGTERSADPAKLRQLANEAYDQARQKLRATLTPMPGQTRSRELSGAPAVPGEGGAPAAAATSPKAAPTPRVSGADLTMMRKAHRAGDTRFDDILRANKAL